MESIRELQVFSTVVDGSVIMSVAQDGLLDLNS